MLTNESSIYLIDPSHTTTPSTIPPSLLPPLCEDGSHSWDLLTTQSFPGLLYYSRPFSESWTEDVMWRLNSHYIKPFFFLLAYISLIKLLCCNFLWTYLMAQVEKFHLRYGKKDETPFFKNKERLWSFWNYSPSFLSFFFPFFSSFWNIHQEETMCLLE